MRILSSLRRIIPAVLLGGALLAGAPQAVAAEEPDAPDTAAFVDEVRAQLEWAGVSTEPVDPSVTEAADRALASVLPGEGEEVAESLRDLELGDIQNYPYSPSGQGSSTDQHLLPVESAEDLNYVWRNDPQSKILAGKPFTDRVLHRVSGSWFDAPQIPAESRTAQDGGKSLFGPGTPIFLGNSMMCTLGVTGTDTHGNQVGLTAGHCGRPGDFVFSADSWEVGAAGMVVASNPAHDYAVIQFGEKAELTNTYNGVTVTDLGGPVSVGQQLCKQGVATGHTCGTTWQSEPNLQVSQVCASVGDSGGPMMTGTRMVGMVSGGSLPDQNLSCRSPLQGSLFMPTVSTNMDAVLADLEARGGPGAGLRLN